MQSTGSLKIRKLADESAPWTCRRKRPGSGTWTIHENETFGPGPVWVWCVDGLLYKKYNNKEQMFASKFWNRWFPGGEAPLRLSTKRKQNCIYGKLYFTQDPQFVVPSSGGLKKFTHDPLAQKAAKHQYGVGAYIMVKQAVWSQFERATHYQFQGPHFIWSNRCSSLRFYIGQKRHARTIDDGLEHMEQELAHLLDNEPAEAPPTRIMDWRLCQNDRISAELRYLHEHFSDTEGSVQW